MKSDAGQSDPDTRIRVKAGTPLLMIISQDMISRGPGPQLLDKMPGQGFRFKKQFVFPEP